MLSTPHTAPSTHEMPRQTRRMVPQLPHPALQERQGYRSSRPKKRTIAKPSSNNRSQRHLRSLPPQRSRAPQTPPRNRRAARRVQIHQSSNIPRHSSRFLSVDAQMPQHPRQQHPLPKPRYTHPDEKGTQNAQTRQKGRRTPRKSRQHSGNRVCREYSTPSRP
ncbi:hypothetical protein BDY17DRAFT_296817 [Neohortaea acidophila]|uniref:Uncharacterized protein n=1 Tax=Neohortaea acidophila TaxID=245834 RepID=A0A6A6PUL6_9PEZI|nr:uncharacterized protein BDY17DRAFT_296817 [Neohortaea acidophila]KAF2483123.1 hypothetical protein BDY17DRAFT_296817 [Neohortaea acidophila]